MLNKKGVAPSRRVDNLRRALRACVALCPACHKGLEQKNAPKPKKNLSDFFKTRFETIEGFEVRVRVGKCACGKCAGTCRFY